MNRRKLLTTLGATTFAAQLPAQTHGSVYDPQINALSLEARVPLSNLLSDNPNVLDLPPEVLGAINARALEIRGRIEYNRGARLFRFFYFLVPPSTPYPLPSAPAISDASVGAAFDFSIEQMHWYEWVSLFTGSSRRVVTITGRRLGLYKGTAPLEDEPGVIQLAFDKESPNKPRIFMISFAGAVTAVGTSPVGSIELDPSRKIG